MRVAVATLARGRALHLERQALAVARMRPAPTEYVVLALDEDRPDPPGATVVHRPLPPGAAIRLGAARNEMIAAAARGADLVVCLDVDCLPAPNLLRGLSAAAAETRGRDVLAGPVARLAPIPPRRLAPTPAERRRAREAARHGPRPLAAPGRLLREPRVELFWSLSFAVTPATHARIGGFDERYEGYGAEDTDYGFRACEAGVGLVWVGGAWAYHQHHPVSTPPTEHLHDIVANSRRFHERWGRWPMEGWLDAFARAGLVRWSRDGGTIDAIPSAGR
jgi:N-acetylglucosaminyl-diphospho-decaprenol L-rhamnosyltransferase